MSNELIEIKEVKLIPFFTKGDSVDDILDKIAKEARAHIPDVSTLKGRNAIKANVTKVTKSKTYLEERRKELADEYKAIPKVIDATGRKVKGFLSDVIEEIREPLTAWETIDKAEKAQVIDTKAFLVEYELQHEDSLRDNELVDLKAAQAEADRKAEIERAEIKAAAEAKAKAEQEAADEIDRVKRERKEALDRVFEAGIRREKAEREAVEAQARMKYVAEKAEWDRIELEQQAKRDIEIARQQAERDVEVAAENARQTEVNRQLALQENQMQQQVQREADKNHRGDVNRIAMQSFINAGLSQDQAILAVKAIAKKLIPAVTISY